MTRLNALLFAAALLLTATAPAAAQTHAQGDGVIVFEPTPKLTAYRSKHYRIYTNLSRDETRPIGRHMDTLYEQYDRRFRAFSPDQVQPMPLYLFKTEQQYERFLQEHDIDATHSGGMFFVTHKLEGLATWVQNKSRRKTLEVLQHEGFHQFAWHAIGPSLPVWLNEGLAQYFENAVVTDGRMSLGMTSGTRIAKVKSAIDAGIVMPLDELMAITNQRWSELVRREPAYASHLYAQSWSLAYFLIHGEGGKHQSKLLAYLKQLSAGEPHENAELFAFGPSGLSALNNAWLKHAATQRTDDVAEATDRLEFLGTGLRVLAEQGEDMPADLAALRDTLRRFGFSLRRSDMGVTRKLSADAEEMYRYHREDRGEREFVLLKPDKPGLPPRITAPGLEPEPTLVWYRDADAKLVQEIVYR